MKITLLVLVLLSSALFVYSSRDRNDKKYKVVCYWGSWSYYRTGRGMFQAEDANPNICTHMIYGFAKLNPDNTIGIFDDNLDIGDPDWDSGLPYGLGMYRRFNGLRNYNKHLTTLLSIGGWNEGSDKYSKMVSTASARTKFVNSVIKLLTEHDFDGLDLDWEYPGTKASGDQDRTPGNPADKANYVALLKELHEAFQPHGFVLTAAVSAGKPTIDRAYDIPQVSKYLDIINLMSYDFHGAWDTKTGHNSPLHPHPNDTEADKEFTVEYAVDYWLKSGADPKKLVIGMGLYGRSFTLADPKNHGIGAPVVGSGGPPGPLTEEASMLGYNEICEYLKSSEWKVYHDDIQKVPYAVDESKKEWVGYDDEQSIKDKVDFLKNRGVGGAMVWSIDTDDFHGNCGKGKYPLLKTISRELNGVDGPDVTIPVTHVTKKPKTHKPVRTTKAQRRTTTMSNTDEPTTEGPDTVEPKPTTYPTTVTCQFHCTQEGFFADYVDPRTFHECIDEGNGQFRDVVSRCGPGTHFDDVNKVCAMDN